MNTDPRPKKNIDNLSRHTESLEGSWAFALDADDRGISEAWWGRSLSDTIRLPGSLQEKGFGDEPGPDTQWTGSIFDRSWHRDDRYARYRQPGQIKIPFWLQPKRHYIGVAWYQRTITIPESWRNRLTSVYLERCHWITQAWLDDRELGSRDSLATPHTYDFGQLEPGTYRLTIRCDNRIHIDVGPNAHSVSDHIQTNWNGIIGKLELQSRSLLHIASIQSYPDTNKGECRLPRYG